MKKLILSFALILVYSFAFSSTKPNLSETAKAVNLDEVVDKIDYPRVTNEAGVEGVVIMYVKIDAEGNITENTALTHPCSQMIKSVETAMKDLKFEPAKNSEGAAIASSVRIPFEFKLTID
ncbi:MAG: TonB family protein [Cyclobacteriaceae bacterium]